MTKESRNLVREGWRCALYTVMALATIAAVYHVMRDKAGAMDYYILGWVALDNAADRIISAVKESRDVQATH